MKFKTGDYVTWGGETYRLLNTTVLATLNIEMGMVDTEYCRTAINIKELKIATKTEIAKYIAKKM